MDIQKIWIQRSDWQQYKTLQNYRNKINQPLILPLKNLNEHTGKKGAQEKKENVKKKDQPMPEIQFVYFLYQKGEMTGYIGS